MLRRRTSRTASVPTASRCAAPSHGAEVADSTSFWQPIRFAPAAQQVPATPKLQAAASALNGTAPVFYDVADIEPGGSSLFGVTYDVRNVSGARNAIIEFSRPTLDFVEAFFFTGQLHRPPTRS